MSISLVDQQIADETESLLNYLLSNSYIIKQDILTQLPDKIVDSFIDAYCTDKGHHGKNIPVYYAFPETPPRTAFLLIQFKGSTEDEDSSVLGGLEGPLSDNDEGDTIHERLAVKVDNNRAYVEPNKPVKYVRSIPQTNQYKLDGNRIYIPYIDDMEGKHIDVYYAIKTDREGKIYPIGINTKEGVTIDFIASNTNVIRCLSAIFTYIRVYLKKSLEENGSIYLPMIEMNGMDLIADNQANSSVPGQQLYYRRLQVTYHVTQTISKGAGELLKEFKIKEGNS